MTIHRGAIAKRAAKVSFTMTRDEIMAGRIYTSYLIETDSGAFAKIISATRGADGKITGFAEYENTGLMLRFVQTGEPRYGTWKVRCAIYRSEDTGDMAGTLSFAEKVSGGFFNRDFLSQVQ